MLKGPPEVSHVPIPDPTFLTTQQLAREIANLKELIDARLDGMDKAVSLLQTFADRQPTIAEVANSVSSLERLVEEKFKSVDRRFAERDARAMEIVQHGKEQIDAAFAASQELAKARDECAAAAVTKSEAAFTKQIDQLATLLNTVTNSLNEKIEDIKGNFRTAEAMREGRNTGVSLTGSLIVGAAVVIATVISAVAFFNALSAGG